MGGVNGSGTGQGFFAFPVTLAVLGINRLTRLNTRDWVTSDYRDKSDNL